jgi:tight adherence protein B
MSAESVRPRSVAHIVRGASFVLLGFLLFMAAVVPTRKGSAQATSVASSAKLDVVVVVDNSSLLSGGQLLPDVKTAISAYISALPPQVPVGVIRYGGFPSSATTGLSTNRTNIVARVAEIEPEGNPALFDGLDLAIEQFDLNSRSKRQILLVGTGVNSGSTLSFADVRERMLQRSIVVDAIAVRAAKSDIPAIDGIVASSSGRKYTLNDLNAIRTLAAERVSWATPAAYVAPVSAKPESSLFKSKLVLIGGVLFLAGGIALTFLKPKKLKAPKGIGGKAGKKKGKFDLLGVEEVKKKGGATPVSGIADKLSGAADKVLEKQGKNRSFGATLERAGIALRPGEFIIVAFVTILMIFALMYKFKGIIPAAIVGGVLLVFGPSKYLKRRTAKRSSAFGDQLSDTLQLLSSSLRAGQGLMQAVDSVAREGEAPASDEFKRIVTETRLGRDLIDSLRAMADRVRSEDFNWVIPAIEINREVGGDLAEVLDTVAATIRDRADIRRQVKTLSAEGRLSAYVLLSLPIGIAMFINMSSPDYLAELWKSPGYFLAGAAGLMMVIGGVWLFKLCKIEF